MNIKEKIENLLRSMADRSVLNHPHVRKVAVLLAASFFFIGLGVSIYARPETINNLNWKPAAFLIVGMVPLTILLNALEFILSGRLINKKIHLARALEVTLTSSAANMLPLPGGVLVRIAGLKAAGANYREGTLATVVIAIIWTGVGLFLAGALIFLAGKTIPGAVFISFGILALFLGLFLGRRIGASGDTLFLVFLQKALLVIVDSFRIFLCFAALGIDASFIQAAVFSISSIAGSAVSIVPAGLGVREIVSAFLAPLVGLPPAYGFLSASLDRILVLFAITPASLLFGFRIGKSDNT